MVEVEVVVVVGPCLPWPVVWAAVVVDVDFVASEHVVLLDMPF